MTARFKIGEWSIDPKSGEIRSSQQTRRLQPLPMAVLCRLAEAKGEVVSRDELLADVWHGRAMSDEPINRCVAELRAALGDDRLSPVYIRTIPRRGYQLLARPVFEESTARTESTRGQTPKFSIKILFLAVGVLATVGLMLNLFTTDLHGLKASEYSVYIRQVKISASEPDIGLAASLETALHEAVASLHYLKLNVGQTADDEFVPGRPTFDILGRLERQEDTLLLTVSLVTANGSTIIPIRELVYTEDSWRKLSEHDVGMALAHRVDFVLRPKGIDDPARKAMTPEDYAEALLLRAKLAGFEPYLAKDLSRKADRLLVNYPDKANLHGLKALALAQSTYTDPSAEIRHEVQKAYEKAINIDAMEPFALVAKTDIARKQQIIDVLQTLELAVEAAPSWTRPRINMSNMMARYGYTTMAMVATTSALELDSLEQTGAFQLTSLAMQGQQAAPVDKSFEQWAILTEGKSNWPLPLYYGHYSQQPALMKEYLKTWISPGTADVDMDVLVDGLFDSGLRDAGQVELAKLAQSYKPGQRRWLLFVLQNMYGDTDAALRTYLEDANAGVRSYLAELWMPFAAKLRRSERFGEILDTSPEMLALHEIYGPNNFCDRIDNLWRCR